MYSTPRTPVKPLRPFVTPFSCEDHHAFTFRSGKETDSCKVVRLIGDKDDNVEQILTDLGCRCGAKIEFRNVLSLMMNKIYKLREERNSCRAEIKQIKEQMDKVREQSQCKAEMIGVAVNTEEMEQDQEVLRRELRKLITSASQSKSVEVEPIATQQVRTPPPAQRFTTFQDECETNLLEQSPIFPPKKHTEPSIINEEESMFGEARALKEIDPNIVSTQRREDTKMDKMDCLRNYLKKNSFSLDNLQNYIEKVNCAKELQKCEVSFKSRRMF